METLLQDLRYALRSLARSPGFTSVAVITLALGIGANTAIFSVVDSVLLRPLPVRQPGQIVRLQEYHQRASNLTGATFRDVRERNRVFSHVACYRVFSRNLSDRYGTSAPEQIDVAFVTSDFLPLLGVPPFLGQGFSPERFAENSEGAVILSYSLWQRKFGADPSAVGKTINLHGKAHVVLGVMPMGFSIPEGVQAWVPLIDELAFGGNRRAHLFTTLARVRERATLAAVRADLDSIAAQIQRENRNVDPGFVFRAQRLQDNLVSGVRPTLLLLLGAVGFVLLIVCANVANLLLSRSVARQREIAVRAALGATRLRLMRQFFTESVLLGLLGGTTGCLLGFWLVKLLYAAYTGVVPGLASPRLDPLLLLFVLTVSLLASILFGIIPALQSSSRSIQAQLAGGGRTATGSRRSARNFLVVSEIALAVVLLAGAGLLIHSFILLLRTDPGFDSSSLAIVRLTLPGSRYPGLRETTEFVNSVTSRVRALPGVQSVAASGTLPFEPVPDTDVELEGHTFDPQNEPEVQILTATPDYFRTLGIRLLQGRTFTSQDVAGQQTALVINETMAQRFWPGESALGKRVVMKDWGPPLPGVIVGVVSDVKQDTLESAAQPAIYYSFAQFERGTLTTYLIVRTAHAPLGLAAAIREQVWAVDREQPVIVKPMDRFISSSLQRRKDALVLLGTFSGLAMLLSMVGIYGVMAYSVVQRGREFAIRMALGASPGRVLKLVLQEGGKLALLGVAIGLAGALVTTRLLVGFLYGVQPNDPVTFVVVLGAVVSASLLASYVPARRAMSVDPIVALRYE